jgi:hypothetical protein
VYAVQVTPDAILGRTMSAMMLLGSGANFLGAIVIGVALDGWGVTRTVLGMTTFMALLGMVALVHPAVRSVAGTRYGGRLKDADSQPPPPIGSV